MYFNLSLCIKFFASFITRILLFCNHHDIVFSLNDLRKTNKKAKSSIAQAGLKILISEDCLDSFSPVPTSQVMGLQKACAPASILEQIPLEVTFPTHTHSAQIAKKEERGESGRRKLP